MFRRWLTDLMIHATFWSTLFFSMAYPVTHMAIIENINKNYIALQGVVLNIGLILVNTSFIAKIGDLIFKHFRFLCVLEILAYGVLVGCTAFGVSSIKTYYVVDMFLYALITRNMICCGNRLRRIIYKEKDREDFDNANPIACAIANIIGSVLVFLIPLPLWFAWMLMFIGISVDNAFYIIIYRKFHLKDGLMDFQIENKEYKH